MEMPATGMLRKVWGHEEFSPPSETDEHLDGIHIDMDHLKKAR
jgi:hypothetical protein